MNRLRKRGQRQMRVAPNTGRQLLRRQLRRSRRPVGSWCSTASRGSPKVSRWGVRASEAAPGRRMRLARVPMATTKGKERREKKKATLLRHSPLHLFSLSLTTTLALTLMTPPPSLARTHTRNHADKRRRRRASKAQSEFFSGGGAFLLFSLFEFQGFPFFFVRPRRKPARVSIPLGTSFCSFCFSSSIRFHSFCAPWTLQLLNTRSH